jgi:hypothetical protein
MKTKAKPVAQPKSKPSSQTTLTQSTGATELKPKEEPAVIPPKEEDKTFFQKILSWFGSK